MRRLAGILTLVLLLLAIPFAAVAAQTGDDESKGFIFRATGDVTVAPDETIGTVIVADGNALIDGEVTDTLIVISGAATVNGTVGGDVVMIDADLALGREATVKNVTLFEGTLDRAEGAVITGELSEQGDLGSLGWGAFVFSVVMWIGVTLALIAGAVLFAWLGGRQLSEIGDTLRHHPGSSVVTALVLLLGLPLAAVVAFVTVVGIPIGLVIVLILIPALWVLGYVAAGARLGELLLARLNVRNLLVAAGMGVLLLQLVSLIPAVGPLVAFLAGTYGAGALVYRLVRRPRGEQVAPAGVQPRPAV